MTRATDTTCYMYNIHENSTKWCYNMIFQAKYLIFVSSLRFRSIFKKMGQFSRYELTRKTVTLYFYLLSILQIGYLFIQDSNASLQQTLVPFVVKINKFQAYEFLAFA